MEILSREVQEKLCDELLEKIEIRAKLFYQKQEKRYLTKTEACKYAGVSYPLWTSCFNEVPYIEVTPYKYLYDRQDIDAHLARMKRGIK